MKWFRFYSEFRSDPKLLRMPISHRYAFVILLCLASEGETRGVISGLDDDDISYTLEMATEDWLTLKAKFRAKGLIHWEGESIFITNWDKRQFESDSSAERVARHRANKKKQVCNVTETLVKRHVTPSDTDSYSDSKKITIGKEEEPEVVELAQRLEQDNQFKESEPVKQVPSTAQPEKSNPSPVKSDRIGEDESSAAEFLPEKKKMDWFAEAWRVYPGTSTGNKGLKSQAKDGFGVLVKNGFSEEEIYRVVAWDAEKQVNAQKRREFTESFPHMFRYFTLERFKESHKKWKAFLLTTQPRQPVYEPPPRIERDPEQVERGIAAMQAAFNKNRNLEAG